MGIREVIDDRPELFTESNRAPAGKRRGVGTFGAAFWGALGGMALFAGMFGLCLWLSAGFSIMDVKNETVEKIVFEQYLYHIVFFQLKILLAYLAVGSVLGALYGLVGGGFFSREKRRGRLMSLLCGLLGALTIQIAVLLFALGDTPALYSPWFHETGPPLAALQGMTGQVLTPPVMKILIVLLFFGALWTLAGRISRRLGRPLLGFVCVAGAAGAYTWFATRPVVRMPQDPKRPNVLILSTDSVRPDRLGCYGHFRDTSPNLDGLAADSWLFTGAHVPLARTFPSWASLLTGQYPHTHGIRNMFPHPHDTHLSGSMVRAFTKQDYRTAVLADYAGDIFPRMEAGFDRTIAPDFTFQGLIDTASLQLHFLLLPYLDNEPARKVFPILNDFSDNADPKVLADRVIRYLDEQPDRPFFAAVFFSPTHFPFATHYPYYKRYMDGAYTGPYKFRKPPELALKTITSDDVRAIRALVDGAILAFDTQVGRILEALQARGALENTIIIVTSDHGENLYENIEDLGHGDHFRGNYTLRVPLLVSWPRGVGILGEGARHGRIDGLVSQIDLAPTILSNLGFEPPAPMDGVDLTDLITGKVPGVRDELYAETGLWFVSLSADYLSTRRILYPDISLMGQVEPGTGRVTLKPAYNDITNIAKHRAVFDDQYKVIAMPTSRGMRWECFNRITDPDERANLFEGEVQACEAFKEKLLDWMASAPGVELKNGFVLPAN